MRFSLLSTILLVCFGAVAQDVEVTNRTTPFTPVKQPVYQMAGRNQRVRLFVSNQTLISSLLTKSPAETLLTKDSILESKYSTHFAGLSVEPKKVGFEEFAESSDWYGLVLNPVLSMCASDLLQMLEVEALVHRNNFSKYQVDEINLFIKPVVAVKNFHYKLELSPVASNPQDPALNLQIPFDVKNQLCVLPSPQALGNALKKLFENGEAVGQPQDIDVSNQLLKDSQKLSAFSIGGRNQRTRMFLSNGTAVSNHLNDSPQSKLMDEDVALTTENWGKWSRIAKRAQSPSSLGFSEFGEQSDANGVVINPPLFTCGANALKLLKTVADMNTAIIQDQNIEELNIFLKPVSRVLGQHVKLQISPVANRPADPAINFQVPVVITAKEVKCVLPTAAALEAALKEMVGAQIKNGK